MRNLLTDLMAAVAIATLMAGILTHEPKERPMELRHEDEVSALVEDKLESARRSLAKGDRKRPLSRQGRLALEREVQIWSETLEDLGPRSEPCRTILDHAAPEGAMAVE